MNPYTSTWTGVTPGDGPQEVHLVLLDNGRTRALADEVGRQALRCIRCSACLNVCPVYERTGGHAYGSVYPGPIGAILNPLLTGVGADAQTDSLPYASVAVRRLLRGLPGAHRHPRRCWSTCAPRWSTRTAATVPKAEAVAMKAAAWAFGDARRLRLAERAAGLAGRVARRSAADAARRPAALGRLPGPGSRWTGARDLPAPPRGVVPGLVAAHRRRAATSEPVSARDEILGRGPRAPWPTSDAAAVAPSPRALPAPPRPRPTSLDLFAERVADYRADRRRAAPRPSSPARVAAALPGAARVVVPAGLALDGARTRVRRRPG